jgi:hypothetical protein
MVTYKYKMHKESNREESEVDFEGGGWKWQQEQWRIMIIMQTNITYNNQADHR